jgi:glycosyltransferase involved in cell wall biosynthesis
MNILIASCHFPYPEVPHAGGETVYHIIESLSKRHNIHLLSLIKEEEIVHLQVMKELCEKVEVVTRSSTFWRKSLSGLKMFITSPRYVGHRCWYELQKYAERMLSENHYDVVLIEFTETAMFVKSYNKYPTIIDIMDVISKTPERERLYRRSGVFKASKGPIRNQELSLYRQADRLIVKSESDWRFLKEHAKDLKIDVIPPWVRLGRFGEAKDSNDNKELLFVGALDREVNSESIIYFCDEIFPKIKSKVPEAKLTIVGGGATPKVANLASIPGVQLTGYVSQVEPYYQKATVFVAPLKVGGGIVVKILDAMAAGKPVVTTTAGNEGIEAEQGKELLIADTPNEFATKVINLLLNQELQERISRGAKAFVERFFVWSNNIARLESIIEECANKVRI